MQTHTLKDLLREVELYKKLDELIELVKRKRLRRVPKKKIRSLNNALKILDKKGFTIYETDVGMGVMGFRIEKNSFEKTFLSGRELIWYVNNEL